MTHFFSKQSFSFITVALLLAFGVSAVEAAKPLQSLEIVSGTRDGHGLLCRSQGKTVLLLSGTPEQMGAAHGQLLRTKVSILVKRVLYVVGAGDSLNSGVWFFDRMEEIQRRTFPHIPKRFVTECDALSKAAGVSRRNGRFANLFPERFHCSGAALRGKATVGGQVLHVRVLDYMRDIRLQDAATVTVYMPDGYNAWVSLGYAGFVGTVTAMNNKGLAIGEIGGRGEGDWDGMPMSFLLRDVMERAGSVEEAIEIIRKTPRTCEYYYVVSDKSGAMQSMRCTPGKIMLLKPGQQHEQLPHVPEDVVLVSSPDRAKVLSKRIQEHYGKINATRLIEIIKRPVSMRSNLHNAVFAPESLEMWFADAGRHSCACDEPYARFKLPELIQFFRQHENLDEAASRVTSP